LARASGPDLVAAYDRALRAGHRLLAQRLGNAGRASEAFEHARTCLLRFAGDVDLLADAVVLAVAAGQTLAATETWLELRSRDPARAREHAAGLIDAVLRAANDRVDRSPAAAVELLARGVEIFPEHAALRMSYAGALLAAGEGELALWQARLAAERDPALEPRLRAIASRTSGSGPAVEVPIDPETHVVRATCAVAGRRVDLVVDTGASITILPQWCVDLGTRTGRRVRVQTASGEVEAELFRVGEMTIGGLTVRHVTAAALDLPGTLAGKGLLGMNVLRRLNMELDARRGVMVLRR
jgi:clan AA aspartic protease (TIGR02281 family)